MYLDICENERQTDRDFLLTLTLKSLSYFKALGLSPSTLLTVDYCLGAKEE